MILQVFLIPVKIMVIFKETGKSGNGYKSKIQIFPFGLEIHVADIFGV